MKVIELFCCLTALQTFTSGVEIRCEYRIVSWGSTIGDWYTCDATLTTAGNPTFVTEVSGTHEEGKVNVDVKGLIVNNHRILTTIPTGVETFFTNLEGFEWYDGSISTIDSSTFAPFPNLLVIYLGTNKIVTLDGDVFLHTRKLREIYFNFNKLEHVGHGLLNGLTDLTYANFQGNPCFNAHASTQQKIQELNLQLPIQCPPATLATTTIATTSEPKECADTCTINTEVQKMKESVEENERRMRDEMKNMVKEADEMKDRIEELEKKMREVNSDPRSCNLISTK